MAKRGGLLSWWSGTYTQHHPFPWRPKQRPCLHANRPSVCTTIGFNCVYSEVGRLVHQAVGKVCCFWCTLESMPRGVLRQKRTKDHPPSTPKTRGERQAGCLPRLRPTNVSDGCSQGEDPENGVEAAMRGALLVPLWALPVRRLRRSVQRLHRCGAMRTDPVGEDYSTGEQVSNFFMRCLKVFRLIPRVLAALTWL